MPGHVQRDVHDVLPGGPISPQPSPSPASFPLPSPPLSRPPAHLLYTIAHQAEFLQRRFIDEGLAREFASNAHYHPLNLLGTLQVAGGVPGARVGAPVWSQYAPSQFVHKADGMWSCVHLTAKGYGALYAELLKHALPALRASASASGDATSRAAGRVEQQGGEQGLVEAGRLRRANEAPCVSNAQRQCWHLAPQTTASAA